MTSLGPQHTYAPQQTTSSDAPQHPYNAHMPEMPPPSPNPLPAMPHMLTPVRAADDVTGFLLTPRRDVVARSPLFPEETTVTPKATTHAAEPQL